MVVPSAWPLYYNLADYPETTQLAVPAVVGLVLGWLVYRVVEFPPFVEFLIATEAEMNKVSWTSQDELKRATAVVLVTVALMAVFLFGVDFVWQFLHPEDDSACSASATPATSARTPDPSAPARIVPRQDRVST